MMSRLEKVIEIMALLFEAKNCMTIEQVSWLLKNTAFVAKLRLC